ncbi:PIF1-like helicase-domain-containing protein, partial [Melanogaster broomeanus]
LNDEQRSIFHSIQNSIINHLPAAFFIEGRPGQGKIFLCKALASTLRAQGKIILIIGTSALSATAYERGQTAHHLFGISVIEDSVDVHSSISIFSPHADLIRHADLLIWDELPMMNKAGWEAADQLCRSICCCPHTLFGSKPIVGLGDFRQVAPVVGGGGEMATLRASVKSSSLWNDLHIFQLTTPMRGMGDLEYTALVDHIGEDCSTSQQQLAFLPHCTTLTEATHFLFPPEVLRDPQACLDRAFLSP